MKSGYLNCGRLDEIGLYMFEDVVFTAGTKPEMVVSFEIQYGDRNCS